MSARGQQPTPANSSAQAIPLRDVTITLYRPPHYMGEEGKQPVTITGRQLGQLLAWLLKTRPGIGASHDPLWTADDLALHVEWLSVILGGLAQADDHDNVSGAFYFLTDIVSDLSARLGAGQAGDDLLKDATLALPTRKAVV